ncbi:MAG: hypothetical protein IPG07_19135 [Crocinitomicaceae bacterium]|nr:hypothetical protein [Crocinitomicaceae bacterium]
MNVQSQLSHSVVEIGKVLSSSYSAIHDDLPAPNRSVFSRKAEYPEQIDELIRSSNAQFRDFKYQKIKRSHFRFKDQATEYIKYLNISSRPSDVIYKIYESRDGNIWISYAGGLALLTPTYMYVMDPKTGFPDFRIICFEEFGSSLLLGTFGGGLIEMRDYKYRIHNEKSGFGTNLILDMAVVDSVLYVATYGEGLYKITGETGVQKLVSESLLKSKVISDVCVQNNALYYTDGNGYAKLVEDTLVYFDLQAYFTPDEYTGIQVSEKGEVWLSCRDKFLIKLGQDSLTDYSHLKANADEIRDFVLGSSGTLWIATKGAGLIGVNDYGVLNFDTHQGLTSDKTRSVFIDSYDNIWIGTDNAGINLVSPSNFVMKDATISDLQNLIAGPNQEIIGTENGRDLIFISDQESRRIQHPELFDITGLVYVEKDQALGSPRIMACINWLTMYCCVILFMLEIK